MWLYLRLLARRTVQNQSGEPSDSGMSYSTPTKLKIGVVALCVRSLIVRAIQNDSVAPGPTERCACQTLTFVNFSADKHAMHTRLWCQHLPAPPAMLRTREQGPHSRNHPLSCPDVQEPFNCKHSLCTSSCGQPATQLQIAWWHLPTPNMGVRHAHHLADALVAHSNSIYPHLSPPSIVTAIAIGGHRHGRSRPPRGAS
jgi:hypothetical protein